MLCVMLLGCGVTSIADAEVVETTPARALAPSPRGGMVLAGAAAVWERSDDGSRQLWDQGAARVSSHGNALVLLQGERVVTGPWPEPGDSFAPAASWPVGPAVDIQAWSRGEVLVAWTDGLGVLDLEDGSLTRWSVSLSGIVAINLGPMTDGLDAFLLTEDALWLVDPDAAVQLATDLPQPVSVARDQWGVPWVIADAPAVLGVVTGGVFRPAMALDGPGDLYFDPGQPAAVLIASEAGLLQVQVE